MVYKVLTSVCLEGVTACNSSSHIENIDKNAIDIILGIDDVISMGYRESVTLQEVHDQLKM